ncbi:MULTISPECIES: histidine kinase [unclassified Dehalobacter]|uniref:histidine kinase n=2 Tax=Dehalobacter TaxID=56112 RepID=UPI0003A0DC8F|nr:MULTISPECIES: histidine kinase [unclassified Dehalobacter]RJE47534.1 histidine kinase [Dehalobacter sp. MCB1]TCX48655.1 histidine kinase [Dehalobacter sp. 14DCB1]TCX56297.1 histidine kinase [Dehalobacter sp. 12DCB1]
MSCVHDVVIYFEEGSKTQDYKALAVISSLKKIANIIEFYPKDIGSNDHSAEIIKEEGLRIRFSTECNLEKIRKFFFETISPKDFELGTSDH